MTKSLIIMQGVPGSGKTTIARAIAHSVFPASYAICSTDDFWMIDGVYQFEIEKLGEAHAWNQTRVFSHLQEGVDCIIVDNTNITQEAASPYLAFARSFGYTAQVVRVQTPLDECIRRQWDRPEDRRVPAETILKMASRMERIPV